MSFLRLSLLTVLIACCCSGCLGQMLSVTLPGDNIILSCPEGQEINIISMKSSELESMDNLEGYLDSIPDENCLHFMLLNWSKSVCDNLQECRLPKLSKMMLVCENTTHNVVSTYYHCENKFPNKHTVVACDGQAAKLSCETGVIRIIKSNYGRLDMNTCTDSPSFMTFCTSNNFNQGSGCNGKESCELQVKPSMNPILTNCDNKPKYVYASYVCE